MKKNLVTEKNTLSDEVVFVVGEKESPPTLVGACIVDLKDNPVLVPTSIRTLTVAIALPCLL